MSSSEKKMQPGSRRARVDRVRFVRHKSGGEEERGLLGVQRRQFAFQFDVEMIGAGNIPGTARAGSGFVDRGFHRRDHGRVLPHAEIIVAAPDGNVPNAVGGVMIRRGKFATMAQDIGENPIPAFAL